MSLSVGWKMATADPAIALFGAFVLLAAVALFLVLFHRYGRVEFTWVTLTPDEFATLRALRDGASKARVRPNGPALYRRAMYTNYGATVFQNGVRGKASFGPHARYIFIPFDRVSGIYPVKGTVSLPWLARPLEGLQIESDDGTVLNVNSPYHEMATFYVALQRAMGERFKVHLDTHEVIPMGLLSHDGGIHAAVRRTRTAKPAPDGGWPLPTFMEAPERGALVCEENAADMRLRRLGVAKVLSIFLLLAIPMLPFGWYWAQGLIVTTPTQYPDAQRAVGWVILGGAILAIALVALTLSKLGRMQLLRVFENGIQDVASAGAVPNYTPFSALQVPEHRHGVLSGDFYFIPASMGYRHVAVPSQSSCIQAILARLPERAARPKPLNPSS